MMKLQKQPTQPSLSDRSSEKPFQQTELRPFAVNSVSPSSVIVAKQSAENEEIMKKVEAFFSIPANMGKLLPFLYQTSNISLRMVEWFIFTYCLNHTVDWFIGNDYFNVYMDYQAQMQVNTKLTFDPMNRRWRKTKAKDKSSVVSVYHGIKFFYNDKDYIETCVAQLNFFRWFIGKGVLDFMVEHFADLKPQFEEFGKLEKERKKAAQNKQQKSTSSTGGGFLVNSNDDEKPEAAKKVRIQAAKKVTKKHVEVFVSFD